MTPLIANKVCGSEDGTEGLSEQSSPTRSAFLQQPQLHIHIAVGTRPDWHLRAQERREISIFGNVVVS